jgi:hypothetical protein
MNDELKVVKIFITKLEHYIRCVLKVKYFFLYMTKIIGILEVVV